MAGEGRGHATRVRALVEPLRREHDVTLFASGDAYDLLKETYEGTDVGLHQIRGLRFHYNAKQKLSYRKTLMEAAHGLVGGYIHI